MNKSSSKITFREIWSKYQVWIIFIVFLLAYSIISPDFFTPVNIKNILMQNAMLVVLSFAQLFAVLSGGIDLSVSAVLALSGVITAKLTEYSGMPILASMLIAVLIGTAVGSLNGILVSRLGFAPFIATLSTLSIAKGLTFIESAGHVIYVKDPIYRIIGTESFLEIPILVWIAIVITIIVWFILRHTIPGRKLLALGGNPEAARLAGVNTKKYLFFVYMFSGLLCGMAGVFMSCRLGAGSATTGAEWELDSIAAVVIGGASLAGGIGTAINTMLGALTIGFIRNILNLAGIAAYPQMVVKGVIIILAVLGQNLGRQELIRIRKEPKKRKGESEKKEKITG